MSRSRELLGCYVLPGRGHAIPGGPRAGPRRRAARVRHGVDRRAVRHQGPAVARRRDRPGHRARRRIGAAVTHPGLRHPMVLASMGQTLQSLTGERFRLGLGRSAAWRWRQYGAPAPTLASLGDTADMLRRLWRGETVSYHGPAGDFPELRLAQRADVAPPPLLLAAVGPKTLALAGRTFDGVLLHPFLTPDGVRHSIAVVRDAARGRGSRSGVAALRRHGGGRTRPVAHATPRLAVGARAAGYLQLRGLGRRARRRQRLVGRRSRPVPRPPEARGTRRALRRQGARRGRAGRAEPRHADRLAAVVVGGRRRADLRGPPPRVPRRRRRRARAARQHRRAPRRPRRLRSAGSVE